MQRLREELQTYIKNMRKNLLRYSWRASNKAFTLERLSERSFRDIGYYPFSNLIYRYLVDNSIVGACLSFGLKYCLITSRVWFYAY